MKVLVTGTRNELSELQEDYILDLLDNMLFATHYVVGDCPTGVDLLVRNYCGERGIKYDRFDADWDTYGRAAGPIRNKAMVDTKPDVVLGFPLGASRGTRGCMKLAREAGIPVYEHDLTDMV